MEREKEREHGNRIYIPEQCREELQIMLERPITIVQAAMGYGKTVVVKEFLKDQDVKVIWIDLKNCAKDQRWNYFCGLLRDNITDQPELCDKLESIGIPKSEEEIYFLVKLMNSFRPDYQLVYVIDNFHMVSEPYIFRLIEAISNSDCFNTHVVLLTRDIYSGKFNELMLKGKLALLPRTTFMFREPDIKKYFQLNGIDLMSTAIERLMFLTEGWISAIYLILLNYEKGYNLMIPSNIYEFIDFGWFTSLNEEEVDFLYHIISLGDFSFDQAKFICEESAETAGRKTYGILSRLTKENPFIYYDETRKQYHIHQIVRQFLEKKVSRLPEDKQKDICRIWGKWYTKEQDYNEAIKYYMVCGDYSSILENISNTQKYEVYLDNWMIYREFIQKCPTDIMKNHLESVAVLSMFAFMVGDFDIYQNLKQYLLTNMDTLRISPIDRKELDSDLKVIEILETYNDAESIARLFADIDSSSCCMKAFFQVVTRSWTFGCMSPVLMFWNKAGSLGTNIDDVKNMLESFQEYIPGCGAGGGKIMEAEWCLLKGEFIEAETLSHEGELLASRDNQPGNIISAKIIQMQTAALIGDEERNLRLKTEVEDVIRKCPEDHLLLQNMMELYICNEQISRKDLQTDISWLETETEEQYNLYFTSYPLCRIVQGKYMLMNKEYPKVIGYFQTMIEEPFYNRHVMFMLYSLIFLAISKYQTGKTDQAQQFLIRALELAEKDKVYLPLIEYFEDLHVIETDSLVLDHVEIMVDRLKAQKETAADLKIYLTKREKEQARLAVAGKTNREIADELFIAQSTVKRSMVVIFKKLNISNRQELNQYRHLFE